MAAPALKFEAAATGGMDRRIPLRRWSPTRWPIALRVVIVVAGAVFLVLLVVRLLSGSGERTVRLPAAQVTVATVEKGIFHDLIPLRASVVPRETVYVDAIDGGRVDRVLVEPGDMVRAGQPMLELSNTKLALQGIRQESQITRAFVLRALVWLHIQVNAVEPFPRVAPIELHDAADPGRLEELALRELALMMSQTPLLSLTLGNAGVASMSARRAGQAVQRSRFPSLRPEPNSQVAPPTT